MATRNIPKPAHLAAHYERLARLAHLQGMVEEAEASAEGGNAAILLQRIDQLLAEVTWLQRFSDAMPPLAARVSARLEAIAVELRALNGDSCR